MPLRGIRPQSEGATPPTPVYKMGPDFLKKITSIWRRKCKETGKGKSFKHWLHNSYFLNNHLFFIFLVFFFWFVFSRNNWANLADVRSRSWEDPIILYFQYTSTYQYSENIRDSLLKRTGCSECVVNLFSGHWSLSQQHNDLNS